jgi:hypothetical protein
MLKISVKPDESMNSNNPYDRLFKSVTRKNSTQTLPLYCSVRWLTGAL